MEQSKNSMISAAFRRALDDSHRKVRDAKIEVVCRFIYWLLLFCVVATMLPHPYLNALASSLTVALVVGLLMVRREYLLKKAFVALVCLSLVSGCAPYFAEERISPLNFDICAEGDSCKTGSVQGFALLGFGMKDVSVETAKFNGLITKVMGIERTRGYGLIGVAKIRVVGE